MEDSLAILLLSGPLAGHRLEAQARALLAIPRVIALEPGRARPPRFMRDATAGRQAARMWLPGMLRIVVLYHADQYPLARALCAEHEQAELWYLPPEPGEDDPGRGVTAGERLAFDQAARERATGILAFGAGDEVDDEPLWQRMYELDVISPRAFVPAGEFRRRRTRKGS